MSDEPSRAEKFLELQLEVFRSQTSNVLFPFYHFGDFVWGFFQLRSIRICDWDTKE